MTEILEHISFILFHFFPFLGLYSLVHLKNVKKNMKINKQTDKRNEAKQRSKKKSGKKWPWSGRKNWVRMQYKNKIRILLRVRFIEIAYVGLDLPKFLKNSSFTKKQMSRILIDIHDYNIIDNSIFFYIQTEHAKQDGR